MSAAAYAQSLADVDTSLGQDFQALVNAASQDDVKAALGKLSTDARNLESQLPSDPPPAVAAANQQLSQALDSLASSADSTVSDVGSAVCTSASAVAEFTRSDGAVAFRAAAAALGAADPAYGKTVAAFLPAPIADQNRRLSNGRVLRGSSGPGSLTIDAADTDAVITLAPIGSKTPTASIYVRSNSNATLSDIPASTFDVYVLSGNDWDSAAQKFTRQCAFSKADDTFDFSSSDWTLTLTPQAGGNLSVSPLGPGDVPNP